MHGTCCSPDLSNIALVTNANSMSQHPQKPAATWLRVCQATEVALSMRLMLGQPDSSAIDLFLLVTWCLGLQVADYAFTTLRPQLGMLQYPDTSSLAVADIPGLIRGASQNRGLGHRFLRHVERSRVLAYVLDLSRGVGSDTGPSALQQLEMLQVTCSLPT